MAKGGFSVTTLSKWDFLATKGWAAARIGRVMFVTAHTDAGRDADSVAARAVQLRELAQGIHRLGRGPVVLGADLNLKQGDAGDAGVLHAFLRPTGLEVVLHHRKDVVAVRGLRVEDQRVISLRDRGLSDHDALVARLTI